MIERLQLRGLGQGRDLALLFARLLTGAFLVHGVWDNLTDTERMAEFVDFLATNRFPQPRLSAHLSVYAQFIAGLALIAGLLARFAGLIVCATFVVGYLMVHVEQSFREGWPALALVAIGAVVATLGAGRWSLDTLIWPDPQT